MSRHWIPGAVLAALALGLAACNQPSTAVAVQDARPAVDEPDAPGTLSLVFTYGSEKEKWIKEVTERFNQSGQTVGGKKVVVKGYPMGSGECVDEILNETRHPHLTSPASNAFVVLGNAESKNKTGKELIAGKPRNLVLSPVVIAMWKPMAEALGWPDKEVGWADIKALADAKDGWASKGRGQWGPFKFGHTHPDYSNSGLIAVLEEVYAAAGKTEGLTAADVASDKVARYVADVERSVIHYGESTGFFGRKMFANGPQYLSAAVLYENMVIESYGDAYKDKLPFPVVALYPKEGTFWSDHPVGVVQRDWVTAEHKEAAAKYVDFLLQPEQQAAAMKYGFRPGLEKLKLASPIDKEHGVDPAQPKTELTVPDADVIRAALGLWRKNKKPAQVVLVMDTSGSMQQGGKLKNAKSGAKQLLGMLSDGDDLTVFSFSDQVRPVVKGVTVGKERDALNRHIDSFFAGGETALYDAVAEANDYLQKNARPGMIRAVVVLTDGEDNKSRTRLEGLVEAVKLKAEQANAVRVFAIAYGDEAKIDVLRKIADATEAKAYEGTPQNIKKVFADIGTFF